MKVNFEKPEATLLKLCHVQYVASLVMLVQYVYRNVVITSLNLGMVSSNCFRARFIFLLHIGGKQPPHSLTNP